MKLKDNIVFEYENKKFNLVLRGRIIIVPGKTSNGKTLICTLLSKLKNQPQYAKDYENLVMVNYTLPDSDIIKKLKGKLIIIDNADIVLAGKDDLVQHIALDRNNQYIIFGRSSFELGLSPNYYAELREEDLKFTLHYEYDTKGWF